MSNHTKGPWYIEKSSIRGETIMPIDLDVNEISVHDGLILSLAPEMLSVLEQTEIALGENLVFISDKFDLEIRQKNEKILAKMSQLNEAWKAICLVIKKTKVRL